MVRDPTAQLERVILRDPERSRGKILMFYVYILRTSSNTLYIGQTNSLQKRLQEHKNKKAKSARYIRYFSSFDLVYSEKYATREAAMKREWQLKKWSRKKKEAIIASNLESLKKL